MAKLSFELELGIFNEVFGYFQHDNNARYVNAVHIADMACNEALATGSNPFLGGDFPSFRERQLAEFSDSDFMSSWFEEAFYQVERDEEMAAKIADAVDRYMAIATGEEG